MCGICGYSGWPHEEVLDRMMERMVHRGPDESGQYQEPGLALGIRRLKVIDPEGGQQPVFNETKSIWAVLNGEIYNYRELRQELIQQGHRFQTESDTEVLVHLYEQEGEEGIQRLRGMFAFALWDRDLDCLLLVRDRFGIKPLYYSHHESGVIFASEIPTLLAALPSCSVRRSAIVQYLTFLYVPGPETAFEGIYQLPQGHLLKMRQGKIEIRAYACLKKEQNFIKPEFTGNLEEQFREVLADSVRAHLISDVPLGLFLSGGVDSASLLALMRSQTNGPIRTFSIGYQSEEDQSFNELQTARQLAEHFGTDHTEEQLNPDVVKILPDIVRAMGEPFGDSSAIPTYLVSKLASRSVTVALSGIGGDELFGGYPRYLGIRMADSYTRLPLRFRRWLAKSVAPCLPEQAVGNDQYGRLRRFLSNGHLSAHHQYLNWISFLPPEWGVTLFQDDLLVQENEFEPQHLYLNQLMNWPSDDPSDQAMGMDLQTYLPDDLLRMGDRLSMAHSLELRVPFCDQRVLDFALQLSPSVRFSNRKLKGFMRHALRPLLPQGILQRPKQGFMVPLGRWLRHDLQEMIGDYLSEDRIRSRGYVRPKYVQWLVREHQSGKRNFTDQIYALLVLELWHIQLEEPSVAEGQCSESNLCGAMNE